MTKSRDDPVESGGSAQLADPTDRRANCGVGAVVDLDGGPSHEVVTDALELLANLEHRGAKGAEPDTGDGAGVMVDRPDDFFEAVVDADLPAEYAVGAVFLPQDDDERAELRAVVERKLAAQSLDVLAWREVPTDAGPLGETARQSEPSVWQVFVAPGEAADFSAADGEAFDRALYLARRAVETETADVDDERFYVVSLSRSTVTYKGLLTAEQLPTYYPDLVDDRLRTEVALVHARFSTNTLGAWHLAHPYRNVVHNGEINTVQGNVNWMRARENDLAHEAFGEDDVDTLTPITRPEGSDTASVDHVLELLVRTGRSLPHALRTLVPEAFRGDDAMSDDRRAFYDYHASLMEPWDGPALVLGYDGDRLAGVLDRNGLRPCRYERHTDGRLVMASEVGALEADPGEVVERGRLEPGQLFVADTDAGRLVPDAEAFEELADDRYAEWVDDEQRHLDELVVGDDATADDPPSVADGLRTRQAAFGYTHDQLEELIEPMATEGKDPVGSMGDDTPLSVLADHDRPLFTYFKQLFAQVSNPPIDYIREELVTSLESRLGAQNNLLAETPEHARQLVLDSPVLGDDETARIKSLGDANEDADDDFESVVLDTTFDAEASLSDAVAHLRVRAKAAVEDGADVLVLSDRGLAADRPAIPSLLATGAVHHGLVRAGLRTRCGLVVESGDPREVHHLATLVGYGAGAVNPYLAHETIRDLVAGPDGADPDDAVAAYHHALEDGLLKTMAKMGISTVESYQGAQIFEAVGLDSEFVAEYFEGTEIRTEGIGVEDIAETVRRRHEDAFAAAEDDLERQGEYEHRTGGLEHGWNPETVSALQQAVRSGEYERYEEFADLVNAGNEDAATLRGLLAFDADDRESIPVEEVEPVGDIVERFSTAAMSLGSLSPEAHENNAVAMNRLGGRANTGEGGEPPERFNTEKECAVKQVASGRFGVTASYLANAEQIQIKMAQGSKPGEGGHLPGKKVNEMIAHVRYATPGVGLISPPPLHDIYSIEDLKQLIHDLKAANEDADINVKLVSEAGIGTIAAGVAKANADAIHVSGHSGGTGASPKTSIKNAGLPWELGVAEANQMLRQTGLRDRVRLSADGGLKTGRDAAVAAALGAERFVFGTASLVTSGCVMARVCHTNNCPVGVATQDEDLRERFPGTPDHVVNYMTFVAQELRELLADLGLRSVEELVGRPEFLSQRDVDDETASKLDLSAVLAEPAGDDRTNTAEQAHAGLDDQLDRDLLAAEGAHAAVTEGTPTALSATIDNEDRAVGAMLSGEIASRHGTDGIPEDTLRVDFDGTAGQSFGAFLAPGVRFDLAGAANDYVGKGLSGGKLVVSTPETATYDPAENVVVGNVCLYGATRGEAYVNGVAGERFGVRNSGVKAVVEGAGDHCCEYMTGGVVAVLGETGANFAAGMSGGVAYVYDPDDGFESRLNPEMVTLSESLSDRDEAMLRRLVENHASYTDSERATELLADWPAAVDDFVRVFPDAYAEVIEEGVGDDVRTELPSPAGTAAGTGHDVGRASGDD
ncbi:MAG: glutamate synthase large subunit [Halolamina sp.]